MLRTIVGTWIAVLALAGCASMSNTQKGALIGAGTGAVVGGAVGSAAGNTAVGVIIGAAVGGAAGALIGDYMDDQAEEMQRDLAGAKIERIGEGIKITFESGLLFDVAKSDLKPAAKATLDDLATILNKYPDTNILIEGHTDSDGAEDYNLQLSERRSGSVKYHLAAHAVSSGRMTTIGYGETQPAAPNDTAANKQLNRRVEVAIWANDKLKKEAEKQAG